MSATAFVSTATAKEAVQGHELEILSALGVNWRPGKGHIQCPYPEHGGENDWRWDDKKAKAFCTCATRGDSILNVVMRCEGVDFEAAKHRAVELAGRSDVIRNKGASKGGQRQDVASLLDPPANQRDDNLPRHYIAARLQIDPAAVIMPSTVSTGFKALGYFDAPGKGSTKPVHVGDFPCAVFGTIGADGRRHAHRIYTAPNGQGKADLGTNAAGYPRDPKKSARVADGDNITGRATLFGDVLTAETIVLAEGIETAAALAYALRTAVENGTMAVAAGISATGVAGFIPYPETRRVIVAADRDEAGKPSNPTPSRRGEQAARDFGMRNRTNVEVRIAMPGRAGSKTDWLDVLLSDGVDAVRTGIEKAPAFTPSADDIAAYAARQDAQAQLDQIANEYPLPTLPNVTLSYARFNDEVWIHKHVLIGKGDDQHEVMVPIATPFGVPARLRYASQTDAFGLRLHVRGMDGRLRTIDMERTDFAKMAAAETRGMLYGAGWRTVEDGEKIGVELMRAAGPAQEIEVVRKPGVHDIEGCLDPVFVCPDGTVCGLPEDRKLELSQAVCLPPLSARGGTLQGWKDAIAAAVGVTGCPHWALGAMAAFAGPLINLAGLDSAGINFSGLTSSGKTTAQRIAASAWSRPDTRGDTLFQTAKATVNGLELMASRSNGAVLVLDELAHVSGREVAAIVYTVAGNTGKKRMASTGKARDTYTWATFAVLSAETSLEEKVRKDGGEWTGGQAVRIADIDVTGVDRTVNRETIGKVEGVKTNFGHAGPAFVAALVSEGLHTTPASIREAIKGASDKLAAIGMNGATPDSAVTRSAGVFGLLTVAGVLAQKFGLLPTSLDVGAVIRWAWEGFRGSSNAVALDPERQAISNLQTWVAERWGVTIHGINADGRPSREALGWFDDDAVYVPASRLLDAAGGTLRETEIAKALKANGCLLRTKSDKHTYVDHVPGVGRVKSYVLARTHFGRGSEKTAFKVFAGGRS